MPVSLLLLSVCLLQAEGAAAPFLVLSDTGQRHEGLVVAEPHASPAPYIEVLSRGYARRLLHLYQLEQRFVRSKEQPQPGILVLSDNQGGFPRWGLHFHGPQPQIAYVDLHRGMRPSGFRALDQIFPHELLHIIVRDLAGRAPDGHATQVHAVGVKTDRITAFNEGFAEHAQLMALEDPDAAPTTHAVPLAALYEGIVRPLERYRAALGARVRIVPKAQMTFPFWFSGAEQVQRYHAVRANLFAREPSVPQRLYSNRHAYSAYLLENTLAGTSSSPPKSVARMLATEGVVAALFYRIVTDEAIQLAYHDEPFYARFGTTRAEVDPLSNAYLKVFAAIREGGYDAHAVVRAHQRLFPKDEDALMRIVADIFRGQAFEPPLEIWLLNDAMRTGTSLFDQYRGLPRAPAFDLNAASRADLIAVPGVDLALADRIIAASPFASVDDLRRVPDLPGRVLEQFQHMRRAMLAPPAPGTEAEGRLTFQAVLMPYAWRALAAWLVCAALGAVLYRAVRRVSWWRVAVNGLAAAGVALLAGWTIDPGIGLIALAAPVAIFGLPGSLIRVIRTRSAREGGAVVGAWTLAGLAAAVAVTPIL